MPDGNRWKKGGRERGKKTGPEITVNIYCVLLWEFKRDPENIYLIMPGSEIRTPLNINLKQMPLLQDRALSVTQKRGGKENLGTSIFVSG